MREVWSYLKAVFYGWWGLMSCAIFTFLTIYSTARHETESWLFRASIGLALFLLVVASYLAWRKEHRANKVGPEIMIFWTNEKFLDLRLGEDQITFKNIGSQPALEVTVEKFTRSDLYWTHGIEIPAIGPGESRTVPARFNRELGLRKNTVVGRMHKVLEESGDGPVSFSVRYRNLKDTLYHRQFTLRAVQVDRDLEVACRPGEVQETLAA